MLTEYAAAWRAPNLFREMRQAQDEINRRFGSLRLALAREFPAINIWARPDAAIVTAQVPGVAPEQLEVTVQQDTVTLRGRREPEVVGDDVVVHRQERVLGPFQRAIVLPFRVDAEKVSARFERGVLTLELPRPAIDRPRQIQVVHS